MSFFESVRFFIFALYKLILNNMNGVFISNLNAAGKTAVNADDGKLRSDQLIADAQAILGSTPMLMQAWSNPAKVPDCAIDIYSILSVPGDVERSSFKTSQLINGGKTQAVVHVEDYEKLSEFIHSHECWYAVFPEVFGYKKGSRTELSNVPLVVFCLHTLQDQVDGSYIVNFREARPKLESTVKAVIVATDSSTGLPYFAAVNGADWDNNDIKLPKIDKDSSFIFLSDLPEIPDSLSPSNVIILSADCPAIREDAKKGDVFVFDGLRFIKSYSFEEKVDAVMRQPQKLVPSPESVDGPKCRVYMASSLDFSSLENQSESFYVLLLDDVSVPAPAEAASVSEGDSDSSDSSEDPVPDTIYEKGSFLYVEMGDDISISKVPFDRFFVK